MGFRNPITSVAVSSVAGTVTTASASTPAGPSVRVRASTTANGSSGSITIPVPASTVAGDLLLVFITSSGGGAAPSGWSSTAIYGGTMYTRIATSSDAGASFNWTYTLGNGTYGAGTLLVLVGATTTTVQSSGRAGGAASVSLATGTISSGAFLVGLCACGSSTSGAVWSWGNAAQGGPTSGNAWAQISVGSTNGSQVVGVVTANWTPAASYQAICTNGGGESLGSLVLVA